MDLFPLIFCSFLLHTLNISYLVSRRMDGSYTLIARSLPSAMARIDAMQLHEIRFCQTGNREPAHNHDILALLDQFILQQTPLDHFDQFFSRPPQFNTVRPDAPPERETAIDARGGGIGDDRCAWTIIGNQACGVTGSREHDDCLDADLLRERTRGMANSACLRKTLTTRLASGSPTGLSLKRNPHHHLHRFDGIIAAGSFGAEHNCVGSIKNGI